MYEELSNAWKNKNIFQKQLEYNKKEFSSYPPHWISSIRLMDHFNVKNVLDVGCGCGSFYKVCQDSLPEVSYTGMDYSKDAIELAKETWDPSAFFAKDVLDLTEEDVEPYDLLFMGALLDVRPDGDRVLDHVLSLQPNNILISRMKLTESESFYHTYEAYDEITTCAYHHNKENFVDVCKENSYNIFSIEDNFFLKSEKNDVGSS